MVANLDNELNMLVYSERRIQNIVINLRAFCERSENFCEKVPF